MHRVRLPNHCARSSHTVQRPTDTMTDILKETKRQRDKQREPDRQADFSETDKVK